MTEEDLRTLLQEVRLRETSVEDAVGQLKRGPFKTSVMREATPDHHRRLRHGLCEVILGSSKTLEQIISIARELSGQGAPVLITRLDDEKIAVCEGPSPPVGPMDARAPPLSMPRRLSNPTAGARVWRS